MVGQTAAVFYSWLISFQASQTCLLADPQESNQAQRTGLGGRNRRELEGKFALVLEGKSHGAGGQIRTGTGGQISRC